MAKSVNVVRKNGFALLMTLWVLAVLSVLLLTLTMTASSNAKASGYLARDIEARHLLRGGVNRMAAELMPDASVGKNSELEAIKGGMLGTWAVNPSDWSVQKIEDPEVKAERFKGLILCDVTSEDSKLPLNKASKEMLAKLPGISPVLAEEIASVRKAREKDGGLRMTEELLLFEGITGKAFEGEDGKPGLRDLLTTFSDGKVFLNGARKEVLEAIPEVGEVVAREIEEKIKNGHHFERVEDLNQVLGVTKNIFSHLKEWVKVTPAFYRIRARAINDGMPASAEAVVRVGKDNVEIIFMSGG